MVLSYPTYPPFPQTKKVSVLLSHRSRDSLSPVCGIFLLYYKGYSVCNVHCKIKIVQCAVLIVQCSLNNIKNSLCIYCDMCSVHCTLYNVQSGGVQCAECIVHCAVYNMRCVMFSAISAISTVQCAMFICSCVVFIVQCILCSFTLYLGPL